MSDSQHGIVWIDGQLSSLVEARIPVTDRGFLFGHAIFETILAIGDGLVFWEAHAARLRAGSLRARIQCPTEEELLGAISVALEAMREKFGATDQSRMSVRLILTGGNGLNLAPTRSEEGSLAKGRVVVMCKPATVLSDTQWNQGFTLKTCSDSRNKELVDIKSSNYLWNMMCLDDALIEGYDDALFVNASGEISEASTSSFVWMSRDENCIYSAPQESNVLPGTTLMCLQNALEALGHSVKWRSLRVENLNEAAACALISSVRGLVPIRQIDNHVFDVVALRPQLELWNQALYAEQLRNCESLRK